MRTVDSLKTTEDVRAFLTEQQEKYPQLRDKIPTNLRTYFSPEHVKEENYGGNQQVWFPVVKSIENSRIDLTLQMIEPQKAEARGAGSNR